MSNVRHMGGSRFMQRRKQAEGARLSSTLMDRFGRELQEGDLVHIVGKGDIFWQVAKLAPSLYPQAPPAAMELVLVAEFPFVLQGGQRIGDLLLVDRPEPTTDESVEQPPPVESPIIGGDAV